MTFKLITSFLTTPSMVWVACANVAMEEATALLAHSLLMRT